MKAPLRRRILDALRREMGTDRAIPVQYGVWVKDLATLNLGGVLLLPFVRYGHAEEPCTDKRRAGYPSPADVLRSRSGLWASSLPCNKIPGLTMPPGYSHWVA